MEKEKKEQTLDEVQAATRKIESRIDFEKKKLKNYDEIQDNIDSITKRLNNCYDLFTSSMNGPAVDEQLEDMQNANQTFHKNARNYIESTLNKTNQNIKSFNEEKELLQKKANKLADKDSKEE